MNYTKTETMSPMKLKQLQYEVMAWKRTLVFMMEENVHLKSRLTDILQIRLHRDFLGEIESYQNHFIKHDDLIGLLRHDIAVLDNALLKGNNSDNLEAKLFALRNNVGLAQTQFDMLKNEFNSFLLDHL